MQFCNIDFNIKDKSSLFELENDNETKLIIPVNAALIVEANRSKRFLDLLNNDYVTFDGTIPFLVAKIVDYLRFGSQ